MRFVVCGFVRYDVMLSRDESFALVRGEVEVCVSRVKGEIVYVGGRRGEEEESYGESKQGKIGFILVRQSSAA